MLASEESSSMVGPPPGWAGLRHLLSLPISEPGPRVTGRGSQTRHLRALVTGPARRLAEWQGLSPTPTSRRGWTCPGRWPCALGRCSASRRDSWRELRGHRRSWDAGCWGLGGASRQVGAAREALSPSQAPLCPSLSHSGTLPLNTLRPRPG